MVDSGEGRDHDSPERILARRGASEFIGMVFHGYTITHVDTPAHYFWQGKIYNGRSCNLITSREGAQVESRSEEHTSELQSRENLVCRLLLEKKKQKQT